MTDIKYSSQELMNYLQLSYQKTLRLAQILKFRAIKENKLSNSKIEYIFDNSHPLILSIKLAQGASYSYTMGKKEEQKNPPMPKPIYSVKELAELWSWHKGTYSPQWIRRLLDKFQVPIYCRDAASKRNQKGFVYLSDLTKVIQP